jgi:hypothetical protein
MTKSPEVIHYYFFVTLSSKEEETAAHILPVCKIQWRVVVVRITTPKDAL